MNSCLKYDHTYSCFDPEKMVNQPITHIQSTSISCARQKFTAEDKEVVLLELPVAATECLQIEYSPLGMKCKQDGSLVSNVKRYPACCQHSKTATLLKSLLYPSPMINKLPAIKWRIENEKLVGENYKYCTNKNWLLLLTRSIARHGHIRAAAWALGYFALPSAAFPAIKMLYK